MADLYSILAGIEPDQQDIIEAELLAKQILEAKFPDLDLREGTAIRDLTLRPSAFLLALCKRGFDFYFSQNTLSGISDTSSSDIVDGLLGNLFLTRNLGTQAVINARLYFAREKSVTLTSSIGFSTDGSLFFFPVLSTTYPVEAMQYDSYENEWYVDVDLIAAEKGESYNISSGSLLYFTNFDPFFLRAEINYLAQSSTAPETNTEFINRAESAISTRNLINIPSIDNKIRQDFNDIQRVVTIGSGTPEMYRDQVEVTGFLGTTRTGTFMSFTDSNTTFTIVLTNHNFVVGQLINVLENLGNPSAIEIKRVPVSTVIDSSTFKIVLPQTYAPRALAAPIITPVEEDIYIHQGGVADVTCGESVETIRSKFTTDVNGKFEVEGAVYEITRSATPEGDPDTVPGVSSFSVSYPGTTTVTNISVTQNVDGTLTVVMPNHPLSIGRTVKLTDWPQSGSTTYRVVTDVLGIDSVKLNKRLPLASPVSPGPSLAITYVDPRSDVGFSDRQKLIVDFGNPQANKTATMEIKRFDRISDVQAYLELPENKVICSDLLARGYDFYSLSFDIDIYDTTLPSTAQVSDIIAKFLEKMEPGQEFILADLVAELTANGISKLKTPLTVTYKYYNKDWLHHATGTSTDVIECFNSTTIFLLNSVTVDSVSL